MRITKTQLMEMLSPLGPECQLLLTDEHRQEYDNFRIVATSPDTVARIEFFSGENSPQDKISQLEGELEDAEIRKTDLDKLLSEANWKLSQAEEKLAKIGEVL